MKPSFFLKIPLIFLLFFYFTKGVFSLSVLTPDKIRVALIENAENIEIAIKGPYKITTIETGEILKQGDTLWQGVFTPVENGIHLKTVKDEDFKIYGINIIPENSPSIYFGKNLYRGTLQIIKTQGGLLAAINVLNLEDYIKGVLYHEISHRWPPEAIKAQAVASRTFAIYQAQENFNKDYYLKADVASQMYRGVFAEKARTDKAVDETAGQILMYRGKVLPAFFHAACGGNTENVSSLWKISSRPLRGVVCPFCKNSPYFKWEKAVPLSEIEEKIARAKGLIGKIKSIKILSRNKSGRVKGLRIRYEALDGRKRIKSINMTAKEFRSILGSKVLSSTNFIVTIKGNEAVFNGYGWGHGVGLCQWGAFAMAKKKHNYKEILKHYYPGAEVVTLEQLDDK